MQTKAWLIVLVLLCSAVQSRAELVVMKFGATWCKSCIIQDKHFKTRAAQKVLKDFRITVWSYDADGHPEAFKKYKVEALPYMRLVDYDRKKNTARTIRVTAQGELIPADKLPAWLMPLKEKKDDY